MVCMRFAPAARVARTFPALRALLRHNSRTPTMSTSSLIESDRKHLIHPVASLRAHEERGVTILESGRGAWLRDIDGNELLDAFSGLWCVNTGYGHDSIVRVATEQMSRLPYATGYFHFGCE